MSSRTIKLTLEYSGTPYAGWQIQPHKKTIQGMVQDVLRRVTQDNKIRLIGASRTDTGVHALGQVAHFRTRSKISCDKLFFALAGLLPEDISVREVQPAEDGFHARKKAKRKKYLYLVWNARARPALLKDRVWHVWSPLDLRAMRKAAKELVGRHDFSAFRAHQSDTRTSVRTIYKIEMDRKQNEVQIQVMGNGFLKYMVRNIVGTLADVGKGKLTVKDVRMILKGRDRKKAGATAPACGLYLLKVDY